MIPLIAKRAARTALTTFVLLVALAPGAAGQSVLTGLDELTPASFQAAAPPSVLLTAGGAYDDFLALVAADFNSLVTTYRIDNPDLASLVHETLQGVAFHAWDLEAVLVHADRLRALEKDPARRLTSGMLAQSLVAAARATGEQPGRPGFGPAFRTEFAKRVNDLPYDAVAVELNRLRGQMEVLSEPLLVGALQGNMDPGVAERGGINRLEAAQIVQFRAVIEHVLPLKTQIMAVIDEAAAGRSGGDDIWAERSATLEAGEGSEVVVAVWDSGVDPDMFPGQMYVNPKEVVNGRDDDANGFVDDIHGIAFGADHLPSVGPLFVPEGIEEHRARLEPLLEGVTAARSGFATDEALAFQSHLEGLEPKEVQLVLNDLGLFNQHVSGTHLAGIVARGNPHARILAARMMLGIEGDIPESVIRLRLGEEARRTVEYFRKSGVRVVNVSWSIYLQEGDISSAGLRDDFLAAFAAAPDLLFVVDVPRDPESNSAADGVPASLDLPNILRVGSVGRSGQPAVFTVLDPRVDVYANGQEVESVIPGGNTLSLSGWTPAVAQVSAVAAQMLALDPSLTPEQVVRLIRTNAAAIGGGGDLRLLHPAATLDAVRRAAKGE